uniref:cholesterol 7-desaturase n=1 Tax=Dracunculus medinensis TaxID=318479 RepID=A0A0N4U8U9_DRAME
LIIYGILSLVIYLLYKILIRPLNRIRRFGDVGIHFGKSKIDDRHKMEYLERIRRIRRVGNIPPVYPNGWFCIAQSSEIKPKEVKPVEVFGEQLTLLRSESGEVYLVDSYCPHLGANLSIGGRVVNENCIQCPFHGWIFSGETGKCVSIPYNKQSIPEQAKIAIWPTTERNHHIYVWYHCDGLEPCWEVEPIEEVENGNWTYNGKTEHEICCHIEDIPENGSDIAHLNFLHLSAGLHGNDITKIEMDNQEPLMKHIWDGNWEQQPAPNQHIGVMSLSVILSFAKIPISCTETKLKARQIGPGIVYMTFDFGKFGRGVLLHHVTPVEPLLQKTRFVMYSTMPKIIANIFLIFETTQFERDIYIWNNKCYIKPALIVKNDGPIHKHRRWFSQFYSENSPKLNNNGTVTSKPKSIYDW